MTSSVQIIETWIDNMLKHADPTVQAAGHAWREALNATLSALPALAVSEFDVLIAKAPFLVAFEGALNPVVQSIAQSETTKLIPFLDSFLGIQANQQ